MRLTIRAFAAHLGVDARTVNKRNSAPSPFMASQQDQLLRRSGRAAYCCRL
ncbi:MAG: hypothetical protein ACRDRW_11035 [Pseudonocardiaceae bacterium]